MKHTLTLISLVAAFAVTSFAQEIPDDVRAAVKELKQYDQSQSRKPLFTLEQFVGRATGNAVQMKQAAAMLAEALADANTTPVARTIFCQQLAMVATDAEVPMLAKLLDDPQLSDPARYVLEAMRSAAADDALRESLSRLAGRQLIGVINSLGNRRDVASLAKLQEMLASADREIAIAAARALGSLGTREAAAALAKSDDVTAKLLCAQRLVQSGSGAMAVGMCRGFAAPGNPPDQRVAALAILAGATALDSDNLIIQAIADTDPFVAANAIRFSIKIKNPKVTIMLAEQLKKPDAPRQVLILNALADRRDAAALAAVGTATSDANEEVRVAALAALGEVGSADSLKLLAPVASMERGRVKAAADDALAALRAEGVDNAIIAGISTGDMEARAAMIGAAASRGLCAAIPELLKAAGDNEKTIRVAAAQALAKIGRAEDYSALVHAMLAAIDPAARDALGVAVSAVGKRISDPQAKIAPLMAALQDGKASKEGSAAVLRALAGVGGAEALAAITARIGADDEAVREAAVRALAEWPDKAALESLLKLAETSPNELYRALAMRGVLRLAPSDAQPMKLMARVQALAKSKDEKKQLLSALSQLKDPSALEMATGFLADEAVTDEAALAVTQIASSLVKSHPDAVDRAMTKVLAAKKDSAEAKSLQAQVRKLLKAKSESSRLRRDGMMKSLAAGSRLVAYLDCGMDSEDRSADGVRMWVVHGKDYEWSGEGSDASASALSVAFGAGQVVVNASGLDSKKSYGLGFTWWDYDDNKREESVSVSGKQIVEKTTLPAWKGKKLGPATLTRAIPAEAIRDGKIEIVFKQEGVGNCVVSEIWLIERTDGIAVTDGPSVTTAPPKPEPKPMAASISAKSTNPGAVKKALIVTGMEYPGHKWRETAPFLCGVISEDKRIGVEINDDAKAALESPSLGSNDVIVMNYMNWENPGPGDAAQDGLRKAVENGTGLVLVHFACGAFQTWPEFVKIAGRIWNPKFRGHDARGPFNVRIVDAQHEIMKGFKDFGTDDELYTCLDGSTPIHVLADANSKVDKKDYPMAFVLQYGKGRVFLSTLGHDVKALSFPDVKILYRRATAWAAGLAPEE